MLGLDPTLPASSAVHFLTQEQTFVQAEMVGAGRTRPENRATSVNGQGRRSYTRLRSAAHHYALLQPPNFPRRQAHLIAF